MKFLGSFDNTVIIGRYREVQRGDTDGRRLRLLVNVSSSERER
jgi:hypothetical protein